MFEFLLDYFPGSCLPYQIVNLMELLFTVILFTYVTVTFELIEDLKYLEKIFHLLVQLFQLKVVKAKF